MKIRPISETHSEVILTYPAEPAHESVTVAFYGLTSFEPRKWRMQRERDSWILKKVLPNDTQTLYCFAPNMPAVDLADYTLESAPWDQLVQDWVPDPFNPLTSTIPPELAIDDQPHTMSLLRLPKAPPPYPDFGPPLEEHSPRVRLYVPSNPKHLLLCFDGEAHTGLIPTPQIIAQHDLPIMAAFIDNEPPGGLSRMRDLPGYPPFFDWLFNELIPSLPDLPITLAGCSLGGFASTYAALERPDLIANCIAQSPAYFWPGHHILARLAREPLDSHFFLSAGNMETAPTFQNGPSHLLVAQWARDLLIARGQPVTYMEYSGGHDYACWQHTLAKALLAIG